MSILKMLSATVMVGVGLTLCALNPANAQQPAACSANAANSTTNVYSYPYNSQAPGNVMTCGQTVSYGGQQNNLFNYMGIQYATQARWQPSTMNQLPLQGGAVSQVTAGNICPQGDFGSGQSEDCLFLNIWTPKINPTSSDKLLPVMVFIHGGAFVVGAGSDPLYNGAALAATGNMVVVTLNYRLGALGFLTSWDLLANKPVIAGNFGIQDQQNALKWVQKYISSFGGDPTNVTLSGESAGAMSAGLHTFSIPSSTDYFNQTIMESNPLGITYLSPEGAYNDHGSVFLGNLCNVWMDRVIAAGATNPQCLLELKDPSKWKADGPSNITSVQTVDIMNAQGKNNSNCGITNLPACAAALSKINLTWSPVVDGATILGQPISGYQNGSKDKTILMGTNKNEGNLFVGITTSKVPLLGAALSGSDANTVYGLFLDAMFGLNNKISSKSSYNPSNYSEITGQIPNSNPQKNFSISPQEQALSQVVTDYVFNCPNYQLLSNISKSTKSAYTYQFVQAPFFDAYVPNDNYFCMPAAGAVCHGNELPYVFNTLNVMKGTPNTGDPALATFMNSVWAGFVNSSIPAKFSPYSTTASAPVVQLANTSSSPVNAANLNVTNVAAGANCSLF